MLAESTEMKDLSSNDKVNVISEKTESNNVGNNEAATSVWSIWRDFAGSYRQQFLGMTNAILLKNYMPSLFQLKFQLSSKLI